MRIIIKKYLYFLYYLKQTEYTKFKRFLRFAATKTNRSKLLIIIDAINSTFRYNISLLDYFSFHFFELSHLEREKWAGTGYMYLYQLKMNPKGYREVLSDKIKFLNHFKPFIRRRYSDLRALKADNSFLKKELLENKSGKLVLKGSRGQVGSEVEVIKCKDYSPISLIRYMQKNNYDLVEEFVIQHPSLMELSPSGLNTIRIITQLNNDHIDIIGCRLRISVNSPVDNMAAGNLASAIDPETGIVSGPGVYSDITKQEHVTHPVTGVPITELIIPFWKETIDLVTRAALFNPENKSIGWDIAITADGPELIEGNHNWCKLLWQLPVKKGLKEILEKYH